MITEDSPGVYGYTIFCDDIRVEIGHKLTFVGTYTGALLVNGTFPTLLPKLAMHVVYMQRRPDVIPPSKFLIFLPGADDDKPSFGFDIPQDVSEQMLEDARKSEEMFSSEHVYAMAGVQFGVLNLILPQPGLIKVRAVRGDRLIRLGSLQVLQAEVPPPPSNPPPTA